MKTPSPLNNLLEKRQGLILLLIFTASGFSGLIYQSIWSQYLGLYLGHAAYAQALVLAIFMGGMALGSWFTSKKSVNWRNLILGYAIIEGIIGIIALIFHSVFDASLGLAYDYVIPSLNSPFLVYVWKWLSAALLILPQSILLGMTFPLLSGGYIRRTQGQDGQVLSGLYFTNSIGAAAGALASTFILLPALGLPGAVAIAGWINLLVAVAAWGISRVGQRDSTQRNPSSQEQPDTQRSFNPRFVLFAAFITGASSFIYEMGWVRMLNLALGTTLHSFEIMLSAFIAGLAFGGLWIRRRIDRLERPLRAAGYAQLLMGLAVIVSLSLYNSVFDWVGALYNALSATENAYTLYNLGSAVIAMAIMMPAAFFAGMTLPLFTLALLKDGNGESSIGKVYAMNTLGAIAGVFLAIHLLIPLWGLKNAMLVAALADLVLAIALLRQYFRQPFKWDYPIAIAGTVVAVVSTLLLIKFDYYLISSGVFRHGKTDNNAKKELIYYKDGKTASISVTANQAGHISIATNGKVDGAARINETARFSADEPTMVLAAALPLAYTEAPKKAAVIGFGTGLSTHTMLADPGLEVVDTIEIENIIVVGATAFGERNVRAYTDPRSNIHIEDAKSFFSSQQAKYDIILSEPSNPWVSGVGALFSKEFYEFIPNYLNENGILVQWIQLYEINDELVTSMLQGLLPNFDHVEAFLSNDGDMIMLARNGKPLDAPARDIFQSGALQHDLSQIGFDTEERMTFRHIANKKVLEAYAAMSDIETNSDYFPVLSLNAPRTRFMRRTADLATVLSTPELPLLDLLGVTPPLSFDLIPPAQDYYRKTSLTREARLVYDYLLAGSTDALSELPSPIANMLVRLHDGFRTCDFNRNPGIEQQLTRTLHVVAARTIPYLPETQSLQIWNHPLWSQCEQMDARVTAALTLFRAVAKRDQDAMYQTGQAFLDISLAREYSIKNINEYAFLASVLGSLAQSNAAAIGQLEEKYLAELSMGKLNRKYFHLLKNYQQQQDRSLAAIQ